MYHVQAPRWNIRPESKDCEMFDSLVEAQRHMFVYAKGFTSLLDLKLSSVGPSSILAWLMNKIDPDTMVLKVGPGKELKITKEVVHYILGRCDLLDCHRSILIGLEESLKLTP